SLTCGADILGPGFGENVFGSLNLLGILSVDRDEDIACLDLPLVTLGFEFWNSQADQSTRDAADGCADRRTTQRRHNWSRRNERPHSGNGQGTNPSDPSQGAADDTARPGASGGSLGSFRVLFVREVAGRVLVSEQRRDVIGG